MVLDTSAVVACLAGEPEAAPMRALIAGADALTISAFTVFECRVVLGRLFGEAMVREFELLLAKAGVEVVAFDEEQANVAHAAYLRFGKGTGHPAQLNLGDCAAYALAVSRGEPLLYKGADFRHTDVESALPPE